MAQEQLSELLRTDNKILGPKGMLGPNYRPADLIKTPSELGCERDLSPANMARCVGSMNYYVDTIGFGEASGLARLYPLMQQTPLGIRYFVKTGIECSNGDDMYEYINTIPRDRLHTEGTDKIAKLLNVKFKGLAPGIMETSMDALNPMPIFNALQGTGYPRCKSVTEPVGDYNGAISGSYSASDGTVTNQWIDGPVQDGKQTRSVFDSWIEKADYDAEHPRRKGREGFVGNSGTSTVAAGVLFSALVIGTMIFMSKK